ncbi:MAG: glycosyltransferase, partial [Gammaproteobacteria bacterium]|nr:glycosyltransferase [Gammaproteobacteria bacterium]
PIWMAASTHDGEDLPILRAHRQLLADFPDALLILVPRHPERFNAVYQLCIEQGLKTVRRSGYERVQAVHQVLLGDTMGEMLLLYALADVAFVGGSLVAHGGHNVLEPAALGKPVICGPHYFNFLDIVGQMQQAGALREVKDAGELAAAVEQLWHNQELYQAMQKAGYQVLHTNQGALDRLMQVVADIAKTLRG